ncbi:MAG: DNA mismatch repair endonuclease MutL [Bradymonadia bacterium]
MSRIQVLDEALSNQIAAGEVVERPASVVKELLENALDAGATAITVEFEEGGIKKLRVVDNGCGMTREEAPLALKRHATSKIKRVEDLIRIGTLGFRGEALPSIASVSRFSIRTRTPEALGAVKVSIAGGKDLTITDAAGPVGTEMVMTDLFFNIPARRKFLKKPQTEGSHIQEAVQRLALAHPHVAFRLIRDGRTLTDVPRHDDLRDRARALFGDDVAGRLQPVKADGAFHLEGFIGPPDSARTTARHYYLFINGRFVRDRVMMSAVQAAYRDHVKGARHPFVILVLTVPPEAVDVNVHPAKTEVRFVDSGPIHRVIFRAIRGVLEEDPWSAPEDVEVPKGRAYALKSGDTGTLFDGSAPASPGRPQDDPANAAPEPSALDAHRKRVFDVMARLSARRSSMRGTPPPADSATPLELEEGVFPPPGVPLPVRRDQPSDAPTGPSSFDPGAGRMGEPMTEVDFGMGVPAGVPPSMPAGSPEGDTAGEPDAAASSTEQLGETTSPSVGKAPAIAELLGARKGTQSRDLPPRPPEQDWPEIGRAEGAVPFGALRFAGVVGERFALCESGDGLLVVDVDAAAERVIWQRLREGAGDLGVPLPMPAVLHFSPARRQRYEQLQSALSRMGFALEPFGKDALALSRVPMPAAGLPGGEILEALLDEATDESGLYSALAARVARARPLRSLTEIAALLQALHHSEISLGRDGQRGPWTMLSFESLGRRPFPGGRPPLDLDEEET